MEEKKETTKKTNSNRSTQKQETPKIVSLNELNLKVLNASNVDLINEKGNTVMCLLMQEDGKVLTSFMGDYNKEIIKTLEKVNKMYFKNLKKQLFSKKKEKDNNEQNNKENNKQDNQTEKSKNKKNSKQDNKK